MDNFCINEYFFKFKSLNLINKERFPGPKSRQIFAVGTVT